MFENIKTFFQNNNKNKEPDRETQSSIVFHPMNISMMLKPENNKLMMKDCSVYMTTAWNC